MKIGLVVPSFRRPWMVRQFLSAIQSQSRLPDEIVLSVVDPNDIPELTLITLPIKLIYGEAGSCVQRNRGIDYLRYKVDIILFLDDDFLTGNSYIEQLECIFEADPRIVGVTGHVISDGATSRGHTVSEANRLIADYEAKRSARGGATSRGLPTHTGAIWRFGLRKLIKCDLTSAFPFTAGKKTSTLVHNCEVSDLFFGQTRSGACILARKWGRRVGCGSVTLKSLTHFML
jgi:glycosyltransferase involved in cell wall biosynthesis